MPVTDLKELRRGIMTSPPYPPHYKCASDAKWRGFAKCLPCQMLDVIDELRKARERLGVSEAP